MTALARVTVAATLTVAAGYLARRLLDHAIDRVEARLDDMAGEEA